MGTPCGSRLVCQHYRLVETVVSQLHGHLKGRGKDEKTAGGRHGMDREFEKERVCEGLN